jgi:cardiolipin synthase
VHLLTYIFLNDAAGRSIAQALARAARRGVATRLLVDALGSKAFLSSETRMLLEKAGVQVTAALPVSLVRAVLARLDLRNHRKLLVVDGQVAWTGSQNIAEAAFAPKARYAPWVDCVVRIEGPLARELQVVFVEDWSMERDEDLSEVLAIEPTFQPEGVAGQAVATGPNFGNDSMTSLVQAAVQLARREIVLTTPYFVPDLPMQAALGVAARRGVATHLVLPRRNDSWLVQRASRGLYEELLACGVRIHEFTGGLLHAKTIVVDRMVSVVTSANLDRRSFELNFEMGVLLYDERLSERLRRLQQGYMDRSEEMDLVRWRLRPMGRRLLEGAAGLMSPLL